MHGAGGYRFDTTDRSRLAANLEVIAAETMITPDTIHAGLTGFGDAVRGELTDLIAGIFAIPATMVSLLNDMELMFRAVFAPGVIGLHQISPTTLYHEPKGTFPSSPTLNAAVFAARLAREPHPVFESVRETLQSDFAR